MTINSPEINSHHVSKNDFGSYDIKNRSGETVESNIKSFIQARNKCKEYILEEINKK